MPRSALFRLGRVPSAIRYRLGWGSSSGWLWNEWRRKHPRQPRLLRILLFPVVRIGLWAGFTNIDYGYVHGSPSRVHVGERCSTMNTLFNVISGDVYIGDDTLFAHDVAVLTGIHRFHEGRRASLHPKPPYPETPVEGRDVHIGSGCFVGAGATIIGPVRIGDNVIVGAGAVVTRDVPSGTFVAGVPARPVK